MEAKDLDHILTILGRILTTMVKVGHYVWHLLPSCHTLSDCRQGLSIEVLTHPELGHHTKRMQFLT
jgi:hypothetical protein